MYQSSDGKVRVEGGDEVMVTMWAMLVTKVNWDRTESRRGSGKHEWRGGMVSDKKADERDRGGEKI